MGWVHLLGCCLVAYSVPGVLFFATTATRPQLLVVCILAGFTWLLTFLVSSVAWSLFEFMQADPWSLVIVGAALQEIARIYFLKGYMSQHSTATHSRAHVLHSSQQAAGGIELRLSPSLAPTALCAAVSLSATARSFSVVGLHALLYPLTDIYAALAAGLGYALTHITLVHATLFLYALEYGALFPSDPTTCPPFSLFTHAALAALLTGLLHVALMVLQLDAVRRGVRRRMTTGVVLGVMGGVASVLSGALSWGCVISLLMQLTVVVSAGALALLTVQQDDYASKKRV